MNRNAKRTGPGGRLRLGLLVASAAAFLLVPAAAASAVVHIEFAGEGSGEVFGLSPTPGEPVVDCHWNGTTIDVGTGPPGAGGASGEPGLEECETASTFEPVTAKFGIKLGRAADVGSEFGGWEIIDETAILLKACEEGSPTAGFCTGLEIVPGDFTIKATFNLEPTKYALNLTTSGTGSGSFSCDTGSGPEACEAEYVEGTEVEVTANPDTGSELGTVSGTGAAAACAASPCTVTMNEEGSIDAEFNLESFAFGVTVIGEGTVQCDSGGGLGACAAEYTYGTEVEVVAEPNSVEFILAEISGTGSASGCNASPCEFTVTANSSVTAEFKTAAFKDTAEIETVHGEVPETTTLDAAGCEDVDLGLFIPGVDDNYDEECVVVLTSTGAETKFIASDESAEDTGHLVHEGGEYALEDALEVTAVDSQGKGTGPGLTALSPVTLLTFNDPIAKDTTTLTFNQHIGEEEGLLTGVYSKTILLTLEQTA